jgi:hypothetical protein
MLRRFDRGVAVNDAGFARIGHQPDFSKRVAARRRSNIYLSPGELPDARGFRFLVVVRLRHHRRGGNR